MPTGSTLHYFWLSLGMGALSLLGRAHITKTGNTGKVIWSV